MNHNRGLHMIVVHILIGPLKDNYFDVFLSVSLSLAVGVGDCLQCQFTSTRVAFF